MRALLFTRHGDGGRALESAEATDAKLREEAKQMSRRERQATEKKAQRILESAQRKRKGEQHSQRGKK